MSTHELRTEDNQHTCTGCDWTVYTYTRPTSPVTTDAVAAAFAKHLLASALEETDLDIPPAAINAATTGLADGHETELTDDELADLRGEALAAIRAALPHLKGMTA